MQKRRGYGALALGAAVAALAIVPVAVGDGHQDLLRSGVAGSTPLSPPFPAPGGVTLFGVDPGGAPWVANRHSSIRVKRNGDTRIKVVRLVIPGSNPPNPVKTGLVASLVCNGMVVDGATIGPVPFSPEGNAMFRGKFMVPKPCLAPAILLRLSAVGRYIGASG